MFQSSRGEPPSPLALSPTSPAPSPAAVQQNPSTHSSISDFAVPFSPSERPVEKPMDIFLGDRYRTLNLTPDATTLTDEQKQIQQQILLQNKVERFFTEGCLARAAVMGAGGGVLGGLFGAFFFTMKPVDVDTSLPFRDQMRQQYRNFLPEVGRSAKSFAKLGFLYSLAECFIQRERAVHDINNAIYAGCFTGAALSYKGGPWAAAAGCAGFAAFSGIMETLQPFGNMGA
ncbi:mitochondrial inner membrane translocase subunit TIM17, putative [Toxoplasma gondii ME49]|uniref:Mitochondrial import inner membrane translocase subunit TIM22 n=13 Tax=Toxoplasma gondii TaxID=5811 RepID=B9PMH5_TOXGV|nr:mitochondrial inner membrane translocase subunit TIM17, putative [Toxoplasma gondii ME49]EPR62206.1 putative mitochondrial inner membrane translocase subunit TIM17 [Toxoplasma gondii GT1]ESS32520.1 putative mitochondrial inner membrane translocase subunit TIM17 [Toxoplasma gondii VEG]KAF4640608.1 putative mitochondrial inner membrane translocase subunit TIM17 [Toxoplasma gondii]KFG42852.1 mitochondrial import inner membrane translocase subunit TIM protein [Toxoplasma gondii p89]KFG45486.1 m|eukprot:XP_002366234.1 mitochondrial inner membrane translocase subunit TIM17, putative [Toxoplasma gondii ME49]